ncbi:cation diffusion facilitator family transporter [Magnetofaba australis]|nr:cation diffusion facilitator family transporter [Magnetofaba australis]
MRAQNPDNVQPSDRLLLRVGLLSLGVNVVLIALNAVLAWLSGSLALGAEMAHNSVDLLASVGVVLGLRIARRQSSAFPYGLYKVENIVALVIALLIFVTAYEIAQSALFSEPSPVMVDGWIVLGTVIALALPVGFSHYEMRIGRAANAPSLIADAVEFRAHALSSGAVLLGLAGQGVGWALDRWAALFIVAFILMAGWELLSNAMRALLDASLDDQTLQRIRKILAQEPLVAEVAELMGRNAGRFRFVQAILILRTRDLSRGDALRARLSALIRQTVPHVERVALQLRPQGAHNPKVAFAVDQGGQHLAECLCQAPQFVLFQRLDDHGSWRESERLQNPFLEQESGRGIALGRWLVALGADQVVTPVGLEGKGVGYVLAHADVSIVRGEPGADVENLLANMRQGLDDGLGKAL